MRIKNCNLHCLSRHSREVVVTLKSLLVQSLCLLSEEVWSFSKLLEIQKSLAVLFKLNQSHIRLHLFLYYFGLCQVLNPTEWLEFAINLFVIYIIGSTRRVGKLWLLNVIVMLSGNGSKGPALLPLKQAIFVRSGLKFIKLCSFYYNLFINHHILFY